jgi:hypothetical protein
MLDKSDVKAPNVLPNGGASRERVSMAVDPLGKLLARLINRLWS